MPLELAVGVAVLVEIVPEGYSTFLTIVTEPAWWREILCDLGYIEYCAPE